MFYELALIAVGVAGGYWGWYFARHEQTKLYGWLMLVAAVLSVLGFLGERFDKDDLGVPGAIGIGAGVCLLLLGPLARGLARRFAAAERFGAALRMLEVAEVLAPGSGVSDEKALIFAMREIRDGNIDHTVDALTAAKDRAPAEARLAIDERIAMLYLASYRWDDAIAHAEQHLFDAIAAEPTGEADGADHFALRRALGIAPPVYVELLGAYGYKGDLDRAAKMLARLEEVCAGRPDAGIWLHRGRLMFLALAGRVDAVQALVEPRRSRHMKPASRTYWVAVAHERQGALAAAEAAYAKARARTRGRPRVLIDQALERLANAKPAELGPTASEVVARVEAEPPPVVVERVRPRGPIATRILLMTTGVVALTIAAVLHGATDIGTVMRAGAMVRGFVDAGELWRLVSSIFVHVGGIHLLVNVLNLYFFGRLAEQLFGPWRMFAVCALAGIGGAAASYLASPVAISAGASDAIFGLLGAVLVELSWHRRRHRIAWKRGVWGMVAVVTVSQIAIGTVYAATNPWGNGAGLVVGTLAGVLLSPNARWSSLAEHAARAISVVFALAVIASFAMVVRTPIADSLARLPHAPRKLDTVTVTAPVSWRRSGDMLFEPDLWIMISAQRTAATAPFFAELEAYIAAEPERAKQHFDQVEDANDVLVPLPPPWQGKELVVSVADSLGGRQRYRVVVAGRPDRDGIVLASVYLPETLTRAAPGYVTRMLGSVQ